MSVKSKKEKSKISKLIEKSDSENDENEHELSFYINDRVKLMKEVLKIIKPKKIKSMAPDCIKDLDIEEINSMLLEELLGISNKRLKYIFNGQNLGEDSSSTDPEEEKPIDIISLDDVSEDDFIIDVDADKSRKKKQGRVKNELKVKKIKKEKQDKKSNRQKDAPLEEENLMSVLELLELQARARAIRSQLMLEANKKSSQPIEVKIDEDDDDVIIEVPKSEEIVINSSDSETEQKEKPSKNENTDIARKAVSGETEAQKKKITLIRDRFDKQKSSESSTTELTDVEVAVEQPEKDAIIVEASTLDESEKQDNSEENKNLPSESNNDEDEIILIVDQDEIDGLINN